MNIGIICNINYTYSICFSNYYYALKNLFNNVKIINNVHDLNDVDILFIGNDHYIDHLNIWKNDSFINDCNNKKIKVCVYTAEYIQSKLFPWNVDIQKSLERFDNLYQRVIDVDDAIIYNKKIARCLCSRYYKDSIVPVAKIDKCVFIGKMYNDRTRLIHEFQKTTAIDIIPYGNYNWKEYLDLISRYRFVLSPYSNDTNCFHLKFYEALLVSSVPIHQIRDNTLEYYPIEAKYEDAIYFQHVEELPDKIKNFPFLESINKPWLEDELTEFFSECNISVDKNE